MSLTHNKRLSSHHIAQNISEFSYIKWYFHSHKITLSTNGSLSLDKMKFDAKDFKLKADIYGTPYRLLEKIKSRADYSSD